MMGPQAAEDLDLELDQSPAASSAPLDSRVDKSSFPKISSVATKATAVSRPSSPESRFDQETGGTVAGEGENEGGTERGDKRSGDADAADVSDFVDCREVVLFSRIQRMLEASSNSLRQQIVNDESESNWRA